MKNKIFLIAVAFLCLFNLKGQEPITVFYNYIKSTEYLTENGENGSKIDNIVYSNNFGATTQVINISGTPDQKDVAVKQIYGDYGRLIKKMLPVPTSQSGGAIIDEADFRDLYTNYYETNYNEPQYFYFEVELEAPPLNRPLKKSAPGTAWSLGSGNEVEYKYEIAPITPASETVVNYKAITTWNSTNKIYDISLQKVGNYGAGLLHKTTQTDENGHKTEQFVNRKGQTVLIRKFSTTGSTYTITKHDTYYVYDSYGNLTYMLPPKLSDLATITAANITEMGYQYKYDKRNRLVEKQLPGKGLEIFVYDKQDRLVATKDAINPWIFIKYDKFGREAYSGTYNRPETRIDLQNSVDGMGSNNEERVTTAFSQDGTSVYYTKTAFPISSFSLLSVNYYDNYANILPTGLSVPSSVEGQTVISQVNSLNGVPVASYTRILGTTRWEQSYLYYDNKLQPVRNYKVNYLGGYTYIDTKLDFRGKPEYTKTYHKRLTTDEEIVVQDNYTYDHQERLLGATNKIGSGNVERISSNTYDALGHLVSKGVGNTTTLAALQKVDYKYNIRGWMTDINNVETLTQSGFPIDLFAFKIYYNTSDDDVSADLGIDGLFNGNISQTKWRTASDNTIRGYAYEYDQLNRLRNAHYHKPGTTVPFPGNFNERLTYDLNGNITSIKRNSSETDVPTGTMLTDDLLYTYTANSNKLIKVTDAANSTIGFSNGTSGTSNDYSYDANGNMEKDLNKGISNIIYNHLNQPTQVFWSSTKKIEYQYNASGQKVQKLVTNGSSVITTEYLDGFQYNYTGTTTPILEFFPHAEGYVKVTTQSSFLGGEIKYFNYVYNHNDHLGNIRVSYTKDPQTGNLRVLDESHHYPFGLKHSKYNSAGLIWSPVGVIIAPVANNPFKYKFQSQELQDEHDLNWYSYRYRNYDPAIGRFFNVDPLSESFAYNGVYNFSENRVIDGFELEGLETILVNDVTGETKQSKPVELDTVEFGPRKSAPVEYYPIQHHMNGLIHYDYSVAQNQMELVGNNHSYFATPLYSNSSGLVGFGIATGEGRLDYVIDKGKFNDFTRNIDGHYQSADWLSFALQTGNQEHILNYWAATREGNLGDVFSANWQLTKDQWTFENIMGSVSVVGGVSGATRGLTRNSLNFATKASTQYTKSSLKLGQQMHKSYKVGADGIKEFRLPSGKRIDFLDINNRTIYELKPFNPRAMQQGQKQLNMYMQELQTMPQFKGINWKTVLDTY